MTDIERNKETTISLIRNGRALKLCQTKSFWECKWARETSGISNQEKEG